MSRKYIQLSIVAILLSGMLFVMGMNDVVQASNSLDEVNAKIEDMLLDKFNIEGNADFIIRFNEQADLTPAYSMDWDTRGEFVYKTLLEVATRSQENAIKILESSGQKYQTYIAGNDLYVVGGNLAIAQEVASLKEVNFVRATRTYYIDPVVEVRPFENITWAGTVLSRKMLTTVGSSVDALAWGIADTGANQFWTTFEHQGESIVVANIDTGVQWNHPALDQAYKCGTDPTNSACWRDPSNICGLGGACDNNGHGTHTMGTMVGDDDPSLAYQVGMAPDAKWIACKGCESTTCSDAALNACADWILAPGGNTNNRPNLVNNSWGGGGGENWYLAKVNAWRAAGIFPAFSAGNEGEQGCSSLGSPGDYQESFGSAAHDISGNIGYFSSRGPSAYGHEPYTKPNLSAPGVSICSTLPGDSWSCVYSGTSMASPHTAGAVALLWSCNPSLVGQIDQTFQIMQDTADAPPAGSCSAPPDGEGNYTYGYGYLNILAAGSLWCGGTGTIDGHVYDVSTNNPIEGATVRGVGSIGSGPTVITDPNGYYSMTVAPDVYTVTASMVGYIPITASVVVVADTITTQDFELLEQISVVPDPIHINLTFGQTGSLAAIATNNLTQPYTFDFKEIDGGIAADGQTISSSGGPDPFGYIFDDSNEAGGAQFDWIDATDGTPLGLADDGESNVTLPFSINFYGINSTAIRVGNNGGLLFGVTIGDLSPGNANLATTTNNLILPFWDDIEFGYRKCLLQNNRGCTKSSIYC